jgi:molybdopterin-guanine dinucleotide biosynthesis protein A
MTEGKTTGVILAGGRSSRMGGQRKALARLAGRPLLAHVVERLQPQVGSLLLSCEPQDNGFEGFGLPMVPDCLPGFRGPLAGLYSAMQHLADTGFDGSLVLCPCDAPFLPGDLVRVLQEASGGGQVGVPSWQGVLQPTFSLWPMHRLPEVREALVERGQGGPRQVLDRVPHAVVEWKRSDPPPFFNVNTPQDLAMAQGWLDRPVD